MRIIKNSFRILLAVLVLVGCSKSDGQDRGNKQNDLAEEVFPWFRDVGRTDDMTSVEIELFDQSSNSALHFRIPKAYLTSSANWEGGKQDRIKIETGLPDLKPRPGNIWVRQDDPEYDKKIEFFRNGLFIYLNARKSNSSPEVAEGMRKRFSNQGYGSYEKQPHLVHGLEYYIRQCLPKIINGTRSAIRPDKCFLKTYEYFITPLDYNGSWLVLECTRLDINLGGGCQGKASYQGRFLEYIFRRSQLHRWQAFDAAARHLLDQFLFDPSNAKPVNTKLKSIRKTK